MALRLVSYLRTPRTEDLSGQALNSYIPINNLVDVKLCTKIMHASKDFLEINGTEHHTKMWHWS